MTEDEHKRNVILYGEDGANQIRVHEKMFGAMSDIAQELGHRLHLGDVPGIETLTRWHTLMVKTLDESRKIGGTRV